MPKAYQQSVKHKSLKDKAKRTAKNTFKKSLLQNLKPKQMQI